MLLLLQLTVPETVSISAMRQLVRNAESGAPPQTYKSLQQFLAHFTMEKYSSKELKA